MAGHSQFANIKHRKGAQDKKRAKLFSRLAKEITVAARNGLPDPNANPRLRAAIIAARKENMPNDNIQRAMDRATGGGDGAALEEIRYEGYGPGGVAIIVEAVSDNRNRTAADVRAVLTRHGGNLGSTNSVAFMFKRLGIILYPGSVASADAMFEAALDAGAENVESSGDWHEITCQPDDLNQVREALEAKFGEPESAKLGWQPQTSTEIGEETAESLIKLLEALDDMDDVQEVASNFTASDAIIKKLAS